MMRHTLSTLYTYIRELSCTHTYMQHEAYASSPVLHMHTYIHEHAFAALSRILENAIQTQLMNAGGNMVLGAAYAAAALPLAALGSLDYVDNAWSVAQVSFPPLFAPLVLVFSHIVYSLFYSYTGPLSLEHVASFTPALSLFYSYAGPHHYVDNARSAASAASVACVLALRRAACLL